MHILEIPRETSLPRLIEEKQRGWHADRQREGWRGWPKHLATKVDDYLASEAEFSESSATYFIHADLTCDHIIGRLENGHWTTLAVIDFGDAMAGNVFYELTALHFDLFDCDKRLLAVFLKAYGMSADDRKEFVGKAMSTALMHQFDVFGPLFEWKSELRQFHTLEDLANQLWNVRVN
jgi:aminoglycoside/choline kinase family phosphotransferase